MYKNTIGRSTLLASAAAIVLALAFAASQAAGGQSAVVADRGRWTDAARWEAVAQHYAEQHTNRRRALEAETARWTALAEYYRTR